MAAQHNQVRTWQSNEHLSAASTRIFPLSPSISRATTQVETICDLKHEATDKPKTFFSVFGPIGPLLLSAVLISFGWTVWLIVLTIDPNSTANYLMDTAEFDDGNFWLVADPVRSIIVANLIALAALATSYLYAALSMTLWRDSASQICPKRPQKIPFTARNSPKRSCFYQHVKKARAFWTDLTGFSGVYRKYWNVAFKAGDFVIEFVQLYNLMEAGFSAGLCYGYAVLIAVNSLSHALFIFRLVKHTALSEVLVDSIFDMIFAVGYPILLLVYSYNSFSMDRDRARLYQKVFPPGSMELQVRLLADPIETTLFRFCFDSLRTLSWASLVVRVSMNVSFSYRLLRLIQVIKEQRKNQRTSSSMLVKLRTQRMVPRWIGGVFTAVAIAVLVYCGKSVAESQKTCGAFQQCVIFAYRWNPGEFCPCLAFVDVDRAPKTYDEWVHPVDVSAGVRNLAVSGDLQVLQLMNRQMATWPEELQRCSNMQYLSLYYTGVQAIPLWAKSFRRLAFLAIQGRKADTNVVRMPPDLFKDMSSLMYFRLGVHRQLSQLPSFDGLDKLESMSLAVLTSVTALPSLRPLGELTRLELVSLTSLFELPDISFNSKLEHLVVTQAPVCCNGFLGVCNTSSPLCSDMTQDQCVDQPSEETLAAFSAHSDVCSNNQSVAPILAAPTQTQVNVCSGVMYRQCQFLQNGTLHLGMCYNDFFQVISCSTAVTPIFARKQEILLHLGPDCDPVEESWLGCE